MGDGREGDCNSELAGSDGPGERKSGLAGEKVSKQVECEGCKRMRDLKEREPEEERKGTRQRPILRPACCILNCCNMQLHIV